MYNNCAGICLQGECIYDDDVDTLESGNYESTSNIKM